MLVNGTVRINICVKAEDLETDAVIVDQHGNVTVTDNEQFFRDWVAGWLHEDGELLESSSDQRDVNLTAKEDREE